MYVRNDIYVHLLLCKNTCESQIHREIQRQELSGVGLCFSLNKQVPPAHGHCICHGVNLNI